MATWRRLLALCVFLLLAALNEARERELKTKAPKPPPQPPPKVKLTKALVKFKTPLFIPPVLVTKAGDSLTIGAWRTTNTFHPDIPPTPIYAYGTTRALASSPSQTIVAFKGNPITVTWNNNITDKTHIMDIDYTTGAIKAPNGGVPMTVHFHGGATQSSSDGHPYTWWTAFGDTGPLYSGTTFSYTNMQDAQPAWYHDHAIGITRINTYAGLAGLYVIADPDLETKLNLPLLNEFDVPLALRDIDFFTDGTLFSPKAINPKVHVSWIPENFGTYMVVNGKINPFLNVKQAKYRFRVLAGAGSRFFNLRFQPSGKSKPLDMFHFAADGGFFPQPYQRSSLLMSPGQRAEVIVDFSKLKTGTKVYLTNDAATPYPSGPPPTSSQQQIMLFTVIGTPVVDTTVIPGTIRTMPPLDPTVAVNYPGGRFITLSEKDDVNGDPVVILIDGKRFKDPVDVTPRFGDMEIWTIINLTPDTHPFHTHLVTQRVISRMDFDLGKYNADLCWAGDTSCQDGSLHGPNPDELGYRDTVLCHPGQITKVLINFDPFNGASPPYNVSEGPGYVFHCHIVDHEDNDMIRPFVVLPKL